MEVRVKKLLPNAVIPQYAKNGDAGLDLVVADITYVQDSSENHNIGVWVNSGLAFEIPQGYVGLVFPRSSIRNTSLRLSNCVGVIDSGYRGPVKAYFDRVHSFEDFGDLDFKKGDKFAQIIIIPYPEINLVEADELSETVRGFGGFGSTGR